MAIHAKHVRPSSQRRLVRWAKALRNRRVSAFHWRIIGDDRLRASIDRRFDAELRRGNLPGDVIDVVERELGRGVEYRTAIELCEKIERTDEYRELCEAHEKAHWRKMLTDLWAQPYVPLTACAYFVATDAEPVEPDDDALETAAAEVVGLLQAEKLTVYGKRKGNAFRELVPIDNIRDATEDGAPIYGGAFLGESPRLTWAIIPDDGEDVIQNQSCIFWKALAVKNADLHVLHATTSDDGKPDETPASRKANEKKRRRTKAVRLGEVMQATFKHDPGKSVPDWRRYFRLKSMSEYEAADESTIASARAFAWPPK